jgi:DNA-directed RNA polymerase specialized sigma24 family protein
MDTTARTGGPADVAAAAGPADVAAAAGSADPDVGLRAVAALRVLAERLEILQVDNARRLGWSWQEIAERLGVTKQTVHRKHGERSRGHR